MWRESEEEIGEGGAEVAGGERGGGGVVGGWWRRLLLAMEIVGEGDKGPRFYATSVLDEDNNSIAPGPNDQRDSSQFVAH